MRFSSMIRVSSCVALLTAGTGIGCGNVSDLANKPGSMVDYAQSAGYLKLHTAETKSQTYKEVNVEVQGVDVMDASGKWHQISVPTRTINLLALDVEARALLDVRAQLDVGVYTKLRLKLGDGCSIRFVDGSIHALRIPAELTAGLVIDINLDVRADVTADVFIGVDLSSCIQVVVIDGKPCYFLRPLLTAVDRVLTGSISGVVRAKLTGEIMANAKVYAEFFDAQGHPHIQAAVFADAQGRFKLEGLPIGKKYHVVCNPPGFGKPFKIFASAEIELTADVAAKVLDIDLDVDLDLNLSLNIAGSVSGNVTPAVSLDGCDYLALIKEVACGVGCSKGFIVDHTTANVDANESYSFKSLGKGRYAVQASRIRCQNGGLCTSAPLWVSTGIDIDLSLNLAVVLGINL